MIPKCQKSGNFVTAKFSAGRNHATDKKVITIITIALHYIALHYIALHYIALYCIALHCIALHLLALHFIALISIALIIIALIIKITLEIFKCRPFSSLCIINHSPLVCKPV